MSLSLSNPPDLIVEASPEHRTNDEDKTTKTFDEFDDQSILLEKRFHQEISTIVENQNELVEEMKNELDRFLNDFLRKRLENIESLRLLHQKEMNAKQENLSTCFQQQSTEMAELCRTLLVEHHSIPLKFFEPLIEFQRQTFVDLEMSFQKKISYLNEIHSTLVEQLKTKHEEKLDEFQCELKLLKENRRFFTSSRLTEDR